MIRVDGKSLTVEAVERVAVEGERVTSDPAARKLVARSRAVIDSILARRETVYGVTTGFGVLKDKVINPEETGELQENLILSHAAGVGRPVPPEVSRAAMLLRANALSRGHSGVRPIVIDRLLDLLNRRITPVIPQQGSVGASGDLAPLAHLTLVLIGRGKVWAGDRMAPAVPALKRAKLKPLRLEAKEGLALTNGTQLMTAYAALLVARVRRLLRSAEVVGATTLEALKGTDVAFLPELQEVRGHPGQKATARNLRKLLAGSQVLSSHVDCDKVQDAYSLRCMPQVHGAVRDAWEFIGRTVGTELNAATDNPLVFPGRKEGEVVSGGNFHGHPIALAMDLAAITLTQLAVMSERRTERLVNPQLSGLPAFLMHEEAGARPGLNSGFMIAQYTAAALASESKSLSHPASVDSIPTSANQEDYVSMGPIAARKAWQVLENVEQVIAIEWLCAAQGLEFHRPLKAGRGVEAGVAALRARVPMLGRDRVLADDLVAAASLIRDGEPAHAASRAGVELS